MIYTCKPAKIRVYLNNTRPYKSMAAIKAETGCDIIINGQMFNMASVTPCQNMRVDGKTLAYEDKYLGYGWDAGDTGLTLTRDYATYDNFLSCVPLIDAGKALKLEYGVDYPAALGGVRGRTAIGMLSDGRIAIFCSKDGTSGGRSMDGIQDEMLKLGCVTALNLDGGGSSCCITPEGKVTTTRTIYNYICIWEDKPDPEAEEDEDALREKVVSVAKGWLGRKESNGGHKAIIDLYNAHKPLAQGYKVKYTDDWCATFVSACFIKAGLTDIAPTECGCERMIKLYKAKGWWKELDSYIPKPGDLVMYDWRDSGKGDCTGWADHVGIVEMVRGKTITVIEGNKSNMVKRVTLQVDGKNIRGYCLPNYSGKETPAKVQSSKSVAKIAREVIAGKWGIGDARKARLAAAGYDYAAVQAEVNKLLR